MAKLLIVNAEEMIRAMRRAGFVEDRQAGSHLTMYRPETGRRVTTPRHPGDMPRRLIRRILRHADLTPDDLRRLLREKKCPGAALLDYPHAAAEMAQAAEGT